jgi:hypothetical protein
MLAKRFIRAHHPQVRIEHQERRDCFNNQVGVSPRFPGFALAFLERLDVQAAAGGVTPDFGVHQVK